MSDTATKAYLERYQGRENFVGGDTRIYTVRSLRPSEVFRVRDMLTGSDPATFNAMMIISAICNIRSDQGEIPVPFPKNRKEMEPLLDAIGFKALLGPASEAFGKLNNEAEEAPDEKKEETSEAG